VSVANGVVYAGSLSSGPGMNPADPTMFALNAQTGQILWSFASGSSVGSGPAIVDGTVYWGTGYARIGIGSAATTHNFYAFRSK
jgi:polyvinyl alcohol dehydrogenase (cytochrome)